MPALRNTKDSDARSPKTTVALCRLIFALFVILHANSAYGHHPHDIVTSIAFSPNYGKDRTAYIIVFYELKRSKDGGHTWRHLENGLDNNSGVFTDVATTPNGSNLPYVYASTNGSGIYRSNDGGDNWKPINGGLTNLDIRKIVVSPDFDNDHTLVAVPNASGLFISTDAGDNWQSVENMGFPITALTFLKKQGSMRLLAAATEGRIELSDSAFKKWRPQGTIADAGNITALSSVPADYHSDYILAGTSLNGLYKSYDFGESFCHIPALPVMANIENGSHVTSIKTNRTQKGATEIYITMWHDAVLFSSDGGTTWERLNNGVKTDIQADERGVPQFYGTAVLPGNDGHGTAFVAGFAGLFKYDTSGQTWVEMETRPADDISGLAISPFFQDDDTLAAATFDSGAYLYEKRGRKWTSINIGLASTQLWDIAMIERKNGRPAIYAITNRGFLSNFGESDAWHLNRLATRGYWRHITRHFEPDSMVTKAARRLLEDPGLSFPTTIATSSSTGSPGTIFLGTRYRGLLRSIDSGKTWDHPWTVENGWIRSIGISTDYDEDSTVFASLRNKGIFRSTDRGDTWQPFNNGLPPGAFNYRGVESSVIAIPEHFSKDGLIFYGTADGLYVRRASVQSWKKIRVAGNGKRELISAIGVSPCFRSDATLLVSVKGKGLFKSEDGGDSFAEISRGLMRGHQLISAFQFSTDYKNDRTILASSAEEIYLSADSGLHWQKLPKPPVRYEDTKEFLTYTGVWEWEINESFSCRTIHKSSQQGAKVTMPFVGSKLTWYGPKDADCGSAKVFIDGEFMTSIDQFSVTPKNCQAIWQIGFLASGPHTISIEVANSGMKNAGKYTKIDALEIIR